MAEQDPLALTVLYPSEFIKAADLKGRPVTVTIVAVSKDMVPMKGGKREAATVIRLARTQKKIICNRTNAYSLALLLSPNLAAPSGRDWVGRRVTLISDLDVKGKEEIVAIRVQGSPDATPERADAYARAWRGKREGGELCGRLKRAVSVMAQKTIGAPPVEHDEPPPIDPADLAPPAPEDDLFRDDDPPAPAPAANDGPPEPGSDG